MANNTVVQGYLELLADLMTVIHAYPFDIDKKIAIFRKPCKYQFVNTLVALTWHPDRPRTVQELKILGPAMGVLLEWAVAQEVWRRRCIIESEGISENLYFWQSAQHEIDFLVQEQDAFIEVKAGKEAPSNYLWFLKTFPKKRLTIINQNRFDTQKIKGITLPDFLSEIDF